MYRIYKKRHDHVLDFAAEELKKYLRMMMPRCGEIEISYAPDGGDCFCLGLLEDFGLDASDVEDSVLDDVVYIHTDLTGGIIAGSNTRSILLAVYRYLYENGCRWLYPGIDGEDIPVRDIQPVTYRKKADHRFRGMCNEGAESQQCMLETIDFLPKLGMNIYMIEFQNPYVYYERFYGHSYNSHWPAEPVSRDTVLQWKRQCEAEISKRGLQYHDMGHGWTADPFGFDSTEGWETSSQEIPESARQHLALIDGKREFFGGIPLNTNLCMSNPQTRRIFIASVVDYAKNNQHVDFLHVWLADEGKNHCECSECSKMLPSDYYVLLLNELDAALTAEGLTTRIGFCAYQDTLWGPQTQTIRNPQRFVLMYGLISRSYCESANGSTEAAPLQPYVRNGWQLPRSIPENMAFVQDWQRTWQGSSFSYEYHFWIRQYYDPGAMYFSRRIYEDVQGIREIGLDGYVEDGSQRCFFPNGLAFYTLAFALFDRSLSFEEIVEDYFSHAYGTQGKAVAAYLQEISDTFDFRYMCNEYPVVDPQKGKRYRPSHAENLKKIPQLVAYAPQRPAGVLPRVQTVSYRLLELHKEYCRKVAEIMLPRTLGNHQDASRMQQEFAADFGKYEIEIQRYYDHYLCMRTFGRIHGVPDEKPVVPGM